jgi:hypothetical protein
MKKRPQRANAWPHGHEERSLMSEQSIPNPQRAGIGEGAKGRQPSGPVVTYRNGRKRVIAPGEQIRFSPEQIAKNLERMSNGGLA